uniref:E3 ubiquitin ligase TRAF3IP2 n=1 Tax=Knipowitschia caucasica TaxID=637954 RepID=A0AAV2L2A4_KNICA
MGEAAKVLVVMACSWMTLRAAIQGVFLFLIFGNWMNLFQTLFYIGAVAAVGSVLFCVLEELFHKIVHSTVNSALNSLRNNRTLIQIQVTVLVTFFMGVTMYLTPSHRRDPKMSDSELMSRQMEEERRKMARRLDRIQNAGIVVSVGMFVTAVLWESGLLFWILHSYCSDYIHFVGVFILGAGSTFLGIWLRSFPEFGLIPFVVGNLCLLLSTTFLKGGEQQVDLMFDNTRGASVAWATIGFVLTQFTVFWCPLHQLTVLVLFVLHPVRKVCSPPVSRRRRLWIQTLIPGKQRGRLPQTELQKWGLRGIHLRPYQLEGVQWLTQCLGNQEGCILGDEMGLGKTCQTISLLLFISGACGKNGPFLVVSPLSVMENWRKEMESFAPSLKVLCYQGDKEKRAEIQLEAQTEEFHVLLTTYEMCLRDASFFKKWRWEALVVDEAHRLKNQNSLLYHSLTEFSVAFRLLLTGTPIQNNLQELFSLLSFIQPSVFAPTAADNFCSCYGNVQNRPDLAAELQSVLEPFLLRRVKSEVALDLPKKTELVIYHGLTSLQKKYYRAILTKDLEVFGNEQRNRTRLLNVLMQLRKCVIHPYLFDGVEPEPFVMGEHLVEASGKFCLLDSLLSHLLTGGHRVLLFSQMTRTLDILQDYMEYRGYSYERLDGSVRGEERNLAVKNFSTKDVFVFLLSTKAGGVGMNLTAADTVIFMDTDFNPQNDLQAAARCHRIGQTRPVKIIRLLSRDTVEEIMFSRARSKLNLTNTVIEEGRFSLRDQSDAAADLKLSEILKFGVDKLLSSEQSSVQEVKLDTILGLTENGGWLEDDETTAVKEEGGEEGEGGGDGSAEPEGQNHMYFFEGRDYSKDPSSDDLSRFEALMEEHLSDLQRSAAEGPALRHKAPVCVSLVLPSRKRQALTEEEVEIRRERRKEAAAKRAKIQEELKRKQQEEKYQKKMAWWESCGYRSLCLPSVDSGDDDDEDSISSTDSEANAIHYILGDVTHPHAAKEDAIIVHCVDDSGRWGRGGLFSALDIRSDEPKKRYESAAKMKDLQLGNVLLFPIDDKQSRIDGQDQLALIVAQKRDKNNSLSGILLTALEEGLRKIYTAAKGKKVSVHLPRLGHSTKGFNWYGTERLIRKHLATRGVPTYIYYHSRSSRNSAASSSSSPLVPAAETPGTSPALDPPAETPGPYPVLPRWSQPQLPCFMQGVRVFFFNLPASARRTLSRYLLTYDGDEEDVMSSEVTHIVAEVEHEVHLQELQVLLQQYSQAVAVTNIQTILGFYGLCLKLKKKNSPGSAHAPGAGAQGCVLDMLPSPLSSHTYRSHPSPKITQASHSRSDQSLSNSPQEDDETMSSQGPAHSPRLDQGSQGPDYTSTRPENHHLSSYGPGYGAPTPFHSYESWAYTASSMATSCSCSSRPFPQQHHLSLKTDSGSEESLGSSGMSLEQPLSLHSLPPSSEFRHHTLSPYSFVPQGELCWAQCPPQECNRGVTVQKPAWPQYHPGPRPIYPDVAAAAHAHTGKTAQIKEKTSSLSSPLSLEQRRVFVTYEADSDKHVNEVISFVALLRHNGFDTHIDIFEQQFRSISKIDFMERYLSEKEYLIIIIISPKYYSAVTAPPVGQEQDEHTFNTVYIHKQLQNEFIQNGSQNFRFIPILFPGAKRSHVPSWLQNTNVYSWPRDRDDILRRLMRVEKYNPPPIGDLPTIVSIPI